MDTRVSILMDLMGFMRGIVMVRGRMLLEFCMQKELCAQIHGLIEEKKKVTFRMGENETGIDFALKKKEHRWFIQNVKVIPGEFQHALVIADKDKRKIRKVVRRHVLRE